MKIVGSRLLGINYDNSDYDFVELDLQDGSTYLDIVNEHFAPHRHCYHFNKDYRDRVARYEVEDENDLHFIYNPEDYRAGIISENPFNHIEKWLAALKRVNYRECPYFYNSRTEKWYKRFYHVVYNLECIKQNTLHIDQEGLDRVRKFHDKNDITDQDYEDVIREIITLVYE